MKRKEYSIIIPNKVKPQPSRAEISVAYIIADHFKTNIKFIPRNNCKTPDLSIRNINWELKTPTGNGKRNLQHTLSRAVKQSPYIIVDARFSKIHITKIKHKLRDELNKNKQIKRLLIIDKQNNVVEISRNS